jgi:hypothetical protein
MAQVKATKAFSFTGLEDFLSNRLTDIAEENWIKQSRADTCRAFALANPSMTEDAKRQLSGALVEAYSSVCTSAGSAKVMASQDARFIYEYATSATFRAKWGSADSVKAPFDKPRTGNTGNKSNAPLDKFAKAVHDAKLETQYKAVIEYMADHAEMCLALVADHLKAASLVSATQKVARLRKVA